ncbi:tumor necrosis factor receptor superfamily member 5 isoform X2 [Sinocyclocheilus grahami]|uniref:tumor necrosis factor receptor superfamily member 5 isoform X2 n=1 Tax=Sinocyclocheilus grahami TaxID=75366 RepID=UPI0007AC7384|nr:PREDICTED: tumor necrosis factor receptor superfamily member 5-like isoform X2 [Sinocyclocheilus grahami]
MLVTVISVAMVMLTGHLIYGLPMDGKMRNSRALSEELCDAGYYKSVTGCCQCKPGFFTSQKNREDRCYRCFQNCLPEFNMTVVVACTITSDVECRCREGFTCTTIDQYTGQCHSCAPVSTPVPSSTYADVPSSTTPTTSSTETAKIGLGDNSVVVLVLCGFISVMLSVIILMLFLRLCRKKEKECFKHFVRQCSLGDMEVDSETTPPTSQPNEQAHAQEMLSHGSTPTNHNTDCSFHQPISSEQAVPPAGNLGPLHIYGPQTVFVSLLNQFGWDGGEKKAQELQEESLNNTNVSYPQSPPVHLSEEERSRENDFIFFPSQEQGKECHISKEEVL